VVGIVVVSHSSDLARGLVELAGQMAGPDVRIEPAGGHPAGGLGTDDALVRGVVVLGDLGSAILTVRGVLEDETNGRVKLVDAPIVEGAVAAAVISSAGMPLEDVARAAEEARDARKL
jgi:PTS hybrid protein